MKKIIYPLFAGVISIILIGSVVIFVQSFQHLKKNNAFRTRQTHRPMIEISQIQSWMTFDYLNRNFNLPVDYLKKSLSITDTAYPKMTLRRAATSQDETVASLVGQVKEAIKAYPLVVTPAP